MSETDLPICVAALYHFTSFEDHRALREPLLEVCQQQGVKGSLLLAKEGINGTIAGSDEGIDRVLSYIDQLPGCKGFDFKKSRSREMPFLRMKVRLKREIVTMGQPDINPLSCVGRYVEPKDWNALISDPDVVVMDTRNDYEVAIGTFRGAIDPDLKTFRQFPEWFREWRKQVEAQGRTPKVAMFCTGGIRCEKSTAFAREEGIEDVYHLKGGILKYLEEVPEEESLWEGECFVFDQRVSVGHGLKLGQYDLCHACRAPISEEDKKSSLFEEGVSCPHCYATRTEAQRHRYRERQRQAQLAERRGRSHLGDEAMQPH
ncbi:rhodanese-related sulfurtransferase [Saccharibacter sp. 17.LH.SD]|uniref:oxygen-dependent tRNA uridine(34) hydroxylase TrhO n=1 Tax=Saccharibacter sp. 17.LH.SD TaxID=2689393 RepID=UPI00136B5DEB|nr:rhodanese-related sulfurtransferase [Saccharibacter sp. 17.LH.SD]MXV45247.1 rhodanese-related sulfurtransferase [Saccharibacter sp. 17.LH.SD]